MLTERLGMSAIVGKNKNIKKYYIFTEIILKLKISLYHKINKEILYRKRKINI